jgi:Arc/MetJ-type ribon-helix-helix transcriptional regulator
MRIELTRPDIQKFIAEQVGTGNYPSPSEAVEAVIDQVMSGRAVHRLTEEDVRAIEEADASFERGEGIDFDVFAAEMRKKYCGQ